jgi:hypothetical protein
MNLPETFCAELNRYIIFYKTFKIINLSAVQIIKAYIHKDRVTNCVQRNYSVFRLYGHELQHNMHLASLKKTRAEILCAQCMVEAVICY